MMTFLAMVSAVFVVGFSVGYAARSAVSAHHRSEARRYRH